MHTADDRPTSKRFSVYIALLVYSVKTFQGKVAYFCVDVPTVSSHLYLDSWFLNPMWVFESEER